MLTPKQRKAKKLYIRYVIVFCCALIPMLGLLQASLLKGDLSLPISSTVIIFALMNINGLLLLLMLYLVLRNLVELFFERKHKILGNKLRTRLVVSFISLSMIPTLILFLVALRFLSTSMDYWFNSNIENSLQASLKIAQSILHDTEKKSLNLGVRISNELEKNPGSQWHKESIAEIFSDYLIYEPPLSPDALSLFNNDQEQLLSINGKRLLSINLPQIPSEALRHVSEEMKPETITQETRNGELIQSIVPIRKPGSESSPHFLVTTILIPTEQLQLMKTVSTGVTDYRQLIMLKAPIKLSMLTMLLIITLLILFGAIWFGFYIAKSLTGPIKKLAEATRKVADGDLDFVLERESDDEMGLLIDSFNKMTADVSASNSNLAEAHDALKDSNIISEQRRRYLEIVLKNVAAGVIAINEKHEITAINRFAEKLLKINTSELLNKNFHDVLVKPHIAILESFFLELHESNQHQIERNIRLSVRKGETFSLQVNITRLVDDKQNPLGYVIVFDNLTKLEKAQRLAAWQEVARRIAHEIKNPLTPIQLSAQRLRKRYLSRFPDDSDVFDQCTKTIVNQVEEIKQLVSEFSEFARMPQVKKKMGNLTNMANDTLILYKEAHKHIVFILTTEQDIPEFLFDPVQINQVLINLLDNGVKELPDGGDISLSFSLNNTMDSVLISVADTGPGIKDKLKLRLFEPYFSTRKSGTGLGLAIANTIITEHNGTIKIMDNQPKGAIFVIELPLSH